LKRSGAPSTKKSAAQTSSPLARVAINGLMGEVMEDHIRMHVIDPGPNPNSERAQATEELIDVVRSYLK
jgi:DNA-binding FrmR family transcriptional regulator